MKSVFWFLRLALVLGFLLTLAGGPVRAGKVTLLGAGATFPYPLYHKWFDVYHRERGVKVNYQAIGSGGGIRQLLARTVDFGATDAPMSDEELARAPGRILHVPTALGAVAIGYNLPGVRGLRLDPEALVGIYLGEIKFWDDPAIRAANPGLKLPHLPIMVAYRSDGSGTTYVFTDYLCKVSDRWCQRVGRGKAVRWPVGMGGKGNAGVAGLLRQIPGCIGYIELAYAEKNGIPVAALKNRAGRYVKPTLASVSAAASVQIPDDTRCSLTNTPAPEGYPISAFTWIIIYQEQGYNDRPPEVARALVDLLWWCIHEAQDLNEGLLYGRLPATVVQKAEKILKSVTYRGKPIL